MSRIAVSRIAVSRIAVSRIAVSRIAVSGLADADRRSRGSAAPTEPAGLPRLSHGGLPAAGSSYDLVCCSGAINRAWAGRPGTGPGCRTPGSSEGARGGLSVAGRVVLGLSTRCRELAPGQGPAALGSAGTARGRGRSHSPDAEKSAGEATGALPWGPRSAADRSAVLSRADWASAARSSAARSWPDRSGRACAPLSLPGRA